MLGSDHMISAWWRPHLTAECSGTKMSVGHNSCSLWVTVTVWSHVQVQVSGEREQVYQWWSLSEISSDCSVHVNSVAAVGDVRWVVGGASGSRQACLADALSPGVEQLRHRVFVRQLQQFGRHVSVDRLQEAVGTCWIRGVMWSKALKTNEYIQTLNTAAFTCARVSWLWSSYDSDSIWDQRGATLCVYVLWAAVNDRLTVLLPVVGPVRTLIGIISRNAELQRRNAGKVFIIWEDNKQNICCQTGYVLFVRKSLII